MSYPPGQDPGFQQYGGYPAFDPYAINTPATTPHRAAATTQIIIGALGVLLAFCMLGALGLLDRVAPEQQRELINMAGSRGELKRLLLTAGGCSGVPGLLLVVLGIFIWRGARWAVITSLVITVILLLLGLVGMIASIAGGSIQDTCGNIVPMVILGVLIALQIRALGAPAMPSPSQAWPVPYPQEMQPPYPQMPEPPQPPAPGVDELPPPPVPPRDSNHLPPPPAPPPPPPAG